MNWQPIETAPEDTYVLVYCPEYYGDEYVIATLDSTEEGWQIVDPRCPLACTPTHWMHLPEPPAKGE